MKSDEYKTHCIVLTPESEEDIKTAWRELVKNGEDDLTLNKSAVIRKALKNFVKTLTKKRS